MTAQAVPLSVVVTSKEAWPWTQACLESLHAQVLRAGGEILLMDHSGRALPAEQRHRYPCVRVVPMLGESVFRQRAKGMATAGGEVVALTEDHCVVDPDWCDRLLGAHRDRPELEGIGGAVKIGSSERLLDWAYFLTVFVDIMPPVEGRVGHPLSLPIANSSYKRRVLPRAEPDPGWLEQHLNPTLIRDGKAALEPAMIVTHDQRLSLPEILMAHYDNARSMQSMRRARPPTPPSFLPPREVARFVRRQTMTGLRNRGQHRLARRIRVYVLLISWATGLGMAMGDRFGPGRSPARVH